LRWLGRHQAIVFVIVLAGAVWGALWLAYDIRSPINQYVRAFGSVEIDGWSYNDLDSLCIRLEPANGTPAAAAASAGLLAAKKYPDGYVREIVLVSLRDTCNGSAPVLAWAVAVAWPATADASPARGGSQPRAIVLVDAKTGELIASHALGQP
jgi:hypothetical protein